MNMVEVSFWGVRGSVASPGPDTREVGGNTSCVEIAFSSGRMILDAGTGLRALGDARREARDTRPVALALSHFHWDHIQGLPFYAPLYAPTTRIDCFAGVHDGVKAQDALARQMKTPGFPVPWEIVSGRVSFDTVRPNDAFEWQGARIRVAAGHHPGGVLAYRIETGGRSIVYATDTEPYACVDPNLVELASGADLLICDAQYTPDEYRGAIGPSKVGWGHSTYLAAVELAEAARVSELALFHHDPMRTDDGVREIEKKAKERFHGAFAAREGTRLRFAARSRAA